VNAEQAKALQRIRDSQAHLLGLISTVLDYARGAARAISYEITNVPVVELLERAQSFAHPQARAKRIALLCEPCDASLLVRADRPKARQVLVNLLANAVKFTEPGGTITLWAEQGGDGMVALHVRDTGSGIAAEEQERIFQPFVQVSSGSGQAQQGTGLGLAISRDLARGMGGDLTVKSVLGEGSTFTVALPSA
jgi:signal transduction histidine kinase